MSNINSNIGLQNEIYANLTDSGLLHSLSLLKDHNNESKLININKNINK